MPVVVVKKVEVLTQAGGNTRPPRGPRRPIGRPPETPEDRFWKFVNKDGPIKRADLGPCWEWTGARMKDGYGLFRFEGKLEGAHRVSYILKHGLVLGDLMVMHKCDNPPCVNPDHLTEGTNADNLGDMAAKGRARGGRRTKDGREPRNRRRSGANS